MNMRQGKQVYEKYGTLAKEYLEDVRCINAMKQIIEEEILNEIVYVD